MATYKVKKGDTLSKIAAEQGVSINDIKGYRSGNPDLIYEGEELSFGPAGSTGGSNTFNGKDVSGMDIKDLSAQMAQEYGEEPDDTDGPSIDTYKSDYDTYKTKREEAFQNLKGITTDTFNTEYDSRELSKKKERIGELDSSIADLRAARDADLAEVKKNPNLSAAQMTGDVKKQADYYNNQINNLINERNSVAGEYNSELDEIDRIVENAASDAQAEYAYYSGLFNEAGSSISEYEKALREELKDEQAQDNFEKQLEQALTIAQMRASDSGGGKADDGEWRLVYDDFGEPLYWFNSTTKQIEYINPDDNAGGGGSSPDSYDSLDEEIASEDGGGDKKWWQFWK